MKGIVKCFLLIFLTSFFLVSCSDTYNNYKNIEGLKWYKKDVKTFEVNIPEDGSYDLFFAMRHLIGYPFTSIKIKIEQITPDKNKFIKEAEFAVADVKGRYIGDVTGQLWDIENLFSENTHLKKGKYIFKISHTMNSNPVILLVDIGLIVRKTSKK